jgi:signal transduction histidine kinase
VRARLKLIQTEFNRLSEMTTSFLDYARLESGKDKFIFTDFDFTVLIGECLDIIQIQLDGKDIKISTNIADESMRLSGDRDKLKQVVLNLFQCYKYNRLVE